MGKRLRDISVEGSPVELKKTIGKIVKKSGFISRWVDKNIERTNKTAALNNLLVSTSDYLEIASASWGMHISVLALSTRSIYEINIRLRSLIENATELDKWQSELVTDNVQVLEGMLKLRNPSENLDEQKILETEIERLQALLSKYSLPTVKQPASTGNLAKAVNQSEEHAALYKFYSKLVHPSSYLVNNYRGAASIEHQKMLQIQAQLYAHDSISRVCEELSVPYEISRPYGDSSQIQSSA